MADVKIYRLPKTEDPAVLEAQSKPMRIARLKSLQQDPKSFKSKYEDEIGKPQEFWLGRLRPKDCQHFVAVASSPSDPDNTEFKAFMVVITEAMSGKKHDIQTYMLAALWVDPLLRGQKIGSRIIEEGVRWVQEDARVNNHTQIRFRLGVAPDNNRAIRLYQRLGFSVVDKGSIEDDDHFEDNFVEMRQTLSVS